MEEQIQTNTIPEVESAPIQDRVVPTQQVKEGSNKGMFVIAGVIILIIIIGLAGYFYVKGNNQKAVQALVPVSTKNTQATPVLSPTPSPITVQSRNDVDSYLNELNSTNTTSMESDYNQAVAQSSNL